MLPAAYAPNDLVEIIESQPRKSQLGKRQLGRIVEAVAPAVWLVEFADEHGVANGTAVVDEAMFGPPNKGIPATPA
jgi:hypothetical protein